MKKIAFVIITVGKSDYLEDMLSSLNNYKNVILVDNSQEGKCKRLIGKYNFTYCHELKPGVSSARNAGAALVGDVDYIYFLDDDLTFGEKWSQELQRILESDIRYDLVGGRVKADYSKEFNIPPKYLYLVGEKNLGESERYIKKDYVGGCNLLINKDVYMKQNGFDADFGHIGNSIGLNEDVVFQESLRKDGGTVYYCPALEFIHHWSGNKEDLIKRVKLQGVYDRSLDIKLKKLRFVLRFVKYSLYLLLYKFCVRDNSYCDTGYWDCLRYGAYINNCLE